MRILQTETMAELCRPLAAVLQETISAGKTFTLELPGWGFPNYAEGDEYVITHRGRRIFRGWLDTVTQRSEDGCERTVLTMLDAVAWLGKVTSMLQEEVVEIADPMQPEAEMSGISRRTSVATTLGSALANRVIALQGQLYTLRVEPEVAQYCYVKRMQRVYSTLALLQSIRHAHPDLAVEADEEARCIVIGTVRRRAQLELHTERYALQVGEVAPDFASVCHGVLVTVPQGDEGHLERIVYTLPAGVSPHEPGVKVIRTAPAVLHHAVAAAWQYYEVAGKLYHACRVSLPMEQAEGGWTGMNLALTGPGTNPEWYGMRAPVSAVRWDFLARRVEVESSNAVAEPDIPDAAEPPADSEFPEAAPEPSQSEEESESEEESSQSEEGFAVAFLEPTGFEPVPQRGAFLLTLRWRANLPATFTLLVDDGKMPWLYNMRDLTDMRLELPYGKYIFTLTGTTKAAPQQSAMASDHYAYYGPTPPPGGSSGPTGGSSGLPGGSSEQASSSGQPGGSSGPTSSSGQASCGGPCAELLALRGLVAGLEARVKRLEDEPCDCGGLMAAISAAIDEALTHVQVEVQVDGVLEHNEIGRLKFNTGGSY